MNNFILKKYNLRIDDNNSVLIRGTRINFLRLFLDYGKNTELFKFVTENYYNLETLKYYSKHAREGWITLGLGEYGNLYSNLPLREIFNLCIDWAEFDSIFDTEYLIPMGEAALDIDSNSTLTLTIKQFIESLETEIIYTDE